MSKGPRWSDSELDYLYKYAMVKTDAQIGSELNRSRHAITEKRRQLGLGKNKKAIDPEQVRDLLAKHQQLRESTSIADLDEAEKTRANVNELLASPIWAECIQMFSEDELELYKKKYVDFMMTLDTVNEVEKGSMHIMISCLIRINKYQKLEKEVRDMARGSADAELAAKSVSFHREMKDMAELYLKAQQDLDASRSQRIKKEGEQKINLVELLKEVEKKEAREKLGREADAFARIKELESAKLKEAGYVRGD
ncbi:MAG: hypothetical protein MN733_03000 [Nitrososphaera sp.]|nr:hypothetical protein [Nitrososphaera sp.]